MRHTPLLNYALYQAGWFACVLGGAWQHPWAGLAIAVTLIGIHLALTPDRWTECRLVLVAVAVGLVVEVLQIAAGTYRFTSGTFSSALPPPWLLALWAQLATVFRYSLRAVIERPWPAALFGGVGGPLAFLAGERLGAVTLLPPLTLVALRLSVAWALAFFLFSVAVRRVAPAGAGPRYRARW